MAHDIPIGAAFTRTVVVDDARAIDFMGPGLRVYATPAIVEDLEFACRDWLVERLDAEHDSVGFVVEIQHKRGTPLGAVVTHDGRVAAVERNRVTFEVVVRDAIEEIAAARHTRVIVERAKLARMIEAKRARLG
jgi:predicted thioesterase